MEPINQFLDNILKTPQMHIICTYVQNMEHESVISRKARFLALANRFQSIFKLLALSIEQTIKHLSTTNSQFFGNKCKIINIANITKIRSTTHLNDSNTVYLLEPTSLPEFNSILQKIQQSQTQNNIYLWIVPSDGWDLDLTLFTGLPTHCTLDLTQIWHDREITQWLNDNNKLYSQYDKALTDWFVRKITGNAPVFLSELNHPILIKRKEQMEKWIEIFKKQILSRNLDIVLQWGKMDLGIMCRSSFSILL